MSDWSAGMKFPKKPAIEHVSAEEGHRLLTQKQKRPGGKYGITKVRLDGYTFDSGLEAKRYCDLKLREKAGQIKDIEVHPKVELRVGLEVISYKPDFAYFDIRLGQTIIEEMKGDATDRSPRWHLIQKLWRAVGPCRLDVLKGSKRGYRLVRSIVPQREEKTT